MPAPRRRDVVDVLADRRARPLDRGDPVDERVLRGQHHVGRAEQGVGSGREDGDDGVLVTLDREVDLGPLAAPDPVALHALDRVAPVELVEVREQPLRVRGDPQHPLLQRTAVDGVVAALTATVRRHLFVRQHRAERGAPVHWRIVEVREAVLVDERAPRPRVERVPPDLRIGRQHRDQLGDRAGPVRVLVVPGVEQLQEDPLRPAVIRGIDRRDAAARVVAEPQSTQLAAHVVDVRLGRDARMLARLHRELLGGEAERVVAHRVQHVVTGHPLEPRVHVGADVAERVPDVDALAARVREHVEDEQLRAVRDGVEAVSERPLGVRGPEGVLGLPPVLPLRLDLVREAGVVPVRGGVGGVSHRPASVVTPNGTGRRFTADRDPDRGGPTARLDLPSGL